MRGRRRHHVAQLNIRQIAIERYIFHGGRTLKDFGQIDHSQRKRLEAARNRSPLVLLSALQHDQKTVVSLLDEVRVLKSDTLSKVAANDNSWLTCKVNEISKSTSIVPLTTWTATSLDRNVRL